MLWTLDGLFDGCRWSGALKPKLGSRTLLFWKTFLAALPPPPLPPPKTSLSALFLRAPTTHPLIRLSTFFFSSSPASFVVKVSIKKGRLSRVSLQLFSDTGEEHVLGACVDLPQL
jgi:hypothetical protein